MLARIIHGFENLRVEFHGLAMHLQSVCESLSFSKPSEQKLRSERAGERKNGFCKNTPASVSREI